MATRISLAFGALAYVLGSMALAESPPAFPDFSAKRVKPPAAGTTKRITVQIQTAPSVPEPSLPTDQPSQPETPDKFDWFWDTLTPERAGPPGPGRLADALEILSTPAARKEIAQPRLQDVQDIVAQYGLDVMLATIGTDVSPALAVAVIYVEARGKADAVSSAGAQGLMQLIPATAERFSVEDPFDGKQNIQGGVRYLDWLMSEFNQDPLLALAGYNSGENAVKKHQGVPPFDETRAYVPRVLSAFSVAKGLCLTPPLLASDGCVFANLAN